MAKSTWARSTSHASVTDEISPQGPVEGHQSQRKDQSGENDVGDEYRKINRAHPPLPGKSHRAGLIVINEVGPKEQGGSRKGQDHAYLMTPDLVSADEDVSGYEQASRGGIESGVDRGKIGYAY